MRLVNDYYKPGGQTPRVYGAIINVVLALGYRVQFCQLGDATSGFNDAKIKACVENAQAMLDELMIRDEDTLGLQALLGLVSESSISCLRLSRGVSFREKETDL